MASPMVTALHRLCRRASSILLFAAFLAAGFLLRTIAAAVGNHNAPTAAPVYLTARGRQIAATFAPFAPGVKTHSDSRYFYIESDGMPAHRMMVGITNWQQQVPLPQSYVGGNAWRFPLHPVPAAHPLSAADHFFRGAIAIAADGVPIFNALNNRGEDSFRIGELDTYGGHSGRADDYHYHIAPAYLQNIVGKDKPIAYALDGYPIYSATEPDGSPTGKLDAFNGHTTTKLGYHYHATTTYPYLNGGFHGEVTERDGQVDPQPSAQPIRPAMTPLPGARITGFERVRPGAYALTVTLDGQTCHVNYQVQADGTYLFEYVDGQGRTNTQTYRQRRSGPLPAPAPSGGSAQAAPAAVPKSSAGFVLRSPAVGADEMLPVEFTGDGSGISPPLVWSGAPKQTRSYALIMHHIDAQGMTKWYWTLYNIPATLHSLPKNAQGVGTLGNNSVNPELAYAPPHSQGPGPRTYILTLYALSAPPKISLPPWQVSRAVLLEAIKDRTLATAELRVVYTRTTNDITPGTGSLSPGGR